MMQPTIHFLGVHTERYRGKHLSSGQFAAPIVGGTMAHLCGALRHRIKDFKRTNEFPGPIDLNV